MKITIFMVIIGLQFVPVISYSQNPEKISFYTFSVHPKGKSVNVYDYPDRDVVLKILPNKHEDNAGQVLKIIDVKNNWFKIESFLVDEDLWVKEGDLGVFFRYQDSTLFLFEKPDINSGKVKLDDNKGYLIIKDLKQDWVLIRIIIHGRKYEGWLPQNKTCSSPYTTCP
jgi:hypothetical protein